jgi:ankyrin repeat protein
MTLKSVMNRLETLNSNAFKNHYPSITLTSETALDILANNLHIEYTNVLKHILVLIEDTDPGPCLELALRRTLEAMETYTEIATTPLGLDGSPGSRMTEWRSAVLKRLFTIYETRGDYPEAETFAQKLDALRQKLDSSDSETIKRLAHSLNRTSRHMRHVLSDIPIPPKYRGLLHFTNTDPFPSIHRAMLDRNTKVVRFLCDSTKQILENQEDILRRGTLHVAAETANEEVLDRLHPQIRALLGKRDTCLKTPLCVAAQHGDYDFFKKLANLSSDADLNSKDAEGRSVLTLACGAGHFRIAEFLLQKKVLPNDDIANHCSPLNAAASSGHDGICRALLEHGAWVDWFSQDKSPSQIAEEHGHNHIVNLIEEYRIRPQNMWETYQGHPRPLSAAPDSVYIPVDQPTTPQRPSMGMWSPPPSYHRASGSTYRTTVVETGFDLVDHPG